MVKDFEAELRGVIERSPPGSRSQVEQDVKALRAAGVNSFDSLVEVLTRKSEPADVHLSACWLMGQLRDKRAVSLCSLSSGTNPSLPGRQQKLLAFSEASARSPV